MDRRASLRGDGNEVLEIRVSVKDVLWGICKLDGLVSRCAGCFLSVLKYKCR